MKLYVNYDMNVICRKMLTEQLEKLDLNYELLSVNEIKIREELSSQQVVALNENLRDYGIEVIENQKNALVQRTKDTIVEMVYNEDNLPAVKISSYLADKLNHSYGYIANLFSEVTYTSIENFIILQKIERAKHLITNSDLTLTEISHKLNYSSVSHLSNQFKKTTGLSPSVFQKIIAKRRNAASQATE
jgi:AraC-like DNA-binding protein